MVKWWEESCHFIFIFYHLIVIDMKTDKIVLNNRYIIYKEDGKELVFDYIISIHQDTLLGEYYVASCKLIPGQGGALACDGELNKLIVDFKELLKMSNDYITGKRKPKTK